MPGGTAVQNWYFDEALSGGALLSENFVTIDRVNQLKGETPILASGTEGEELGSHAVDYRYADGSVFTLRFRLVDGLATEFDAHLADGSPLPAGTGDGTKAGRTFLKAIPLGQQGGWRSQLDRLVATTRTAVLGREAVRLGRPMEWAEIA